MKDGQIMTNGGRVLGMTATGKDLKEARTNAIQSDRMDSLCQQIYAS
ncbi:MAG: hypothetical protein ACLUTA_14135 [Blautia wexlerae]